MRFNVGCYSILICLLIPSSAISQPDTLWTRTYNIYDSDRVCAVLKTSDGYMGAGETSFESGQLDFLVVKLDFDGNLLWQNTYPDTSLSWPFAKEILEAGEGEYLVIGTTCYATSSDCGDIRILRIDSDGNLLEQILIGGEFEEYWAYAAANTSDGGYIIAGATGIYPSMDLLLMKFDSLLNIEWENAYGGTGRDYPSTVIQTSDGGYLTTGWTYSFGAQSADCYILKTDSVGNIEFEISFGSEQFDRLKDVCETSDGCYLGLWVTYSPGSTTIVKINQDGIIEWQNEYDLRKAYQLLQNEDETIVITGVRTQNFWLMCADSLGNQLWEIFYYAGTLNPVGRALCPSQEGGYFVAAIKSGGGAGLLDLWFLNFESYTGINSYELTPASLVISAVWPNPFQSSVFLEYSLPVVGSAVVSVYDIAGRRVNSFDQSILPVGSSSFCWTPDETLPAGCYTLVVEACGERAAQRCVKLD